MEKQETFPSFRRQNKWLGLIDYKSLIVFGVYILIIYQIATLLKLSLEMTVTIGIISLIPIIAIYFTTSKEESIIDVVFIVLRFYFSNKMYYYIIENREEFDIDIKRKRKININIDKILKWLGV